MEFTSVAGRVHIPAFATGVRAEQFDSAELVGDLRVGEQATVVGLEAVIIAGLAAIGVGPRR